MSDSLATIVSINAFADGFAAAYTDNLSAFDSILVVR